MATVLALRSTDILLFQYLDRNGITDLSRANFTFSTKVCVGEFYETILANGPQGHVSIHSNRSASVLF